MKRIKMVLLAVVVFFAASPAWGAEIEMDTLHTAAGALDATFIGHGSLMLEFGGKVIHVDPVSRYGDYAILPRADIILLTHHHGDHLDEELLQQLRTDRTKVVLTELCAEKVQGGMIMKNGAELTIGDIKIEAVPAYNLVHKRDNGQYFHPRGEGNGYVLSFGGTRVYIAGDTENTPEMKALTGIEYAFLPMNLPYTMTPEMVADAARAFRPKVLYPYHYGETDTAQLVDLLKGERGIEVRVRNMK